MITLYSLYLNGGLGGSIRDLILTGKLWQIVSGLCQQLSSLLMLLVDAALITAVVLVLARKESRRKFLVAVKRKPQNIPLCVLGLAFVMYSFNLTAVSNTTARISGANMGFTGFLTMLFSVLLLVCCMNAFPYRKPTNVLMLVLLVIMIVVVQVCDIYYLYLIATADPSVVEGQAYVQTAQRVVYSHWIVMVIGTVLVATLPLYRKWIKKINTSVEVEDNGSMEAIDISSED